MICPYFKVAKKGFVSLEVAFYSFFLLTIVLSSLKISKKVHHLEIQKIKGYQNEIKKN